MSWDWVVDAVDGEDNRGQGTDHKTCNVVLLEREGERLALEILLVWSLGVTLGHDPSPWNSVAWRR